MIKILVLINRNPRLSVQEFRDYYENNHANFMNPTGARNSANFLKEIVTDNPRTAQLGFRLLF